MDTRHWLGAIGGGLVAGIGITALMIRGERQSGKPSELVTIERAAASRLGLSTPPRSALPDPGEQAAAQAAHLLLSVLAGAAYAAATDEETAPLAGGVVFGLAFYAVAHWIAGPALGLKKPEWRSDIGTIGMHAVNHVAFGLATAYAARAARDDRYAPDAVVVR